MNFRIALILHLVSMAVLAGGGLGGMLLHRPLVAAVRGGTPQLAWLADAVRRLGLMARLGAVLLLASGLYLAWAMHWADFQMRWFHIKLGVYVGMWVLSLGLAAPAAAKFGAALARRAQGEDTTRVLEESLATMGFYNVLILAGFIAIVALVIVGAR